MLVSAPSEKYIELFPMWPRGSDASFHNLRVKGAYLVSANWSAQGAGMVTFLEIEPAAIDVQVKKCVVKSPWHVAQVTVQCAGSAPRLVAVAKGSGVFTFRTENHQRCSISPDANSAIMAEAPIKADDQTLCPSERRLSPNWALI